MHKRALLTAPSLLLLWASLARGDANESVAGFQKAFQEHSGTRLVFKAGDLPPGHFYDDLPVLSETRQLRAARIAVREARKLPRGYLGKIGLKVIGIFEACVARTNDGYHGYDKNYKGYLYFGIWNGRDAVAAAYYSDGQLPLTLHHEIFHHVDATRAGKTDKANAANDERFRGAAKGETAPYPALAIGPADLAALKRRGRGRVLEGAVSEYCKKSPLEDKAETARWFMNSLPDALVQMATRPNLTGSQRLSHVLAKYGDAVAEDGPGLEWFASVALDRIPEYSAKTPAVADNPYLKGMDAKIDNATVRAAIRAVQPACVQVGGGSGINLGAEGTILTAGHVPGRVGAKLTVVFPDGRRYPATCVAHSYELDLAVLRVTSKDKLPFAPLGSRAPVAGTKVVCIGQPGSTRDGKPTGYEPFHVSTGAILGFLDNPLGRQVPLGRTKHSAWTYWGHSGSPIFNEKGRIVAMHNSWDPKTATRHAVTYEAILHFLKEEKIGYTIGD